MLGLILIVRRMELLVNVLWKLIFECTVRCDVYERKIILRKNFYKNNVISIVIQFALSTSIANPSLTNVWKEIQLLYVN